MKSQTTFRNAPGGAAAWHSEFIAPCLLASIHICAFLAIWAEPQSLERYKMVVQPMDSNALVRCMTGVFVFSDSVFANLWTAVFAFAFAREASRQLGTFPTLALYCSSGAFGCLLWGFGFVLTGEKVCLGTPLETSAGLTGLGTYVVLTSPTSKLRAFSPVPIFAWAGFLVSLTVSMRFFWWDKWSMVLPAHLAAATFAIAFSKLSGWRTDCRYCECDHDGPSSRRMFEPGRIDDDSVAARPQSQSKGVRAATNQFHDVGDSTMDASFEARLDEILEKITKLGSDSLTADERGLLLKASDYVRKRRNERIE